MGHSNKIEIEAMNIADDERKVNRKYKDGVFRQLFNNKDKICELYSALSGEDYSGDTDVEIVTLDNAIFGDVKNDLAFIIAGKFVVLTEHQSTVNPNMPFRMAIYLMRVYEKLYFDRRIYSARLIKVPTPELYVFYNGNEERPLKTELKFSDAFIEICDKIAIEVKVQVINVNYEKGAEILKKCKSLSEYSYFIATIKQKHKELEDLQIAIKEAIRECIEEDVLREFLKRNGGEFMSVLYQYLTAEERAEIRWEDGYADGLEAGIEVGIEKSKMETARKMKEEGCSDTLIANVTGFTTEQIEKIDV